MDEQQWYDLFEDVASKLKHENLTRQQQHAELSRILYAERERAAQIVERVEGWEGVREVAARIRA